MATGIDQLHMNSLVTTFVVACAPSLSLAVGAVGDPNRKKRWTTLEVMLYEGPETSGR